MAVATLSLFSHSLGTQQDVSVILPKAEHMQSSALLYLLHGIMDGHHSWIQRTRLVEYAEKYKLVIVMPNAQRSFYANQQQGYAWRDWIETELPAQIEKWFQLPSTLKRHIAGLSMGGYGAMKLALTNPTRYASVASFSGVLHLAMMDRLPLQDDMKRDLMLAFGSLDTIAGSADDLLVLLEKPELPFMYVRCGTEDRLLPFNQYFHDQAASKHHNVDYQELPGDHEWSLWDQNIRDYFEVLSQKSLLEIV